MLSIVAIILSLISIFLMVIILIKFKKLFSTDNIIEKTKKQMNRIVTDVNNNANRDIELINEATKRTKALINEADKKMNNFMEATQRLRDMIAEAEKVSNKSRRNIIVETNSEAKQHKNSNINPDSAYVVNKQPSLFDDLEEKTILKDETIVTSDGAAYKEVPLIITKVFNDKIVDNKIPPKALPEKVEKLFKTGMNIEEIAAELSCSISEVAFIIDML